ncbi:MAG TPA: tetratricopeptide repeat protein [Acidobacteriota bacterium]|nr:tetratricopeptide repeat protein [Acidobacteriota bacterium]
MQVAEVQDAIYRLDFDRAEAACEEMISQNPRDPTGYAFLSIVRWNQLLQAAGNLTLDDYSTPTPFTKTKTYKPIAKESQQFHRSTDKLIELCQQILQNDPSNIRARYFEGLAYENLSSEQLTVLKQRGEGIRFGKKAVEVHRKVLKQDPEFVDANLSIATSEFACATLPWSVKWLAFILGCRGSKEEALAKLDKIAERGVYRRLDALVVQAFLEAWKGDPNRAIQILTALGRQYPMNYLIEINRAAIFEERLQNRKAALAVYSELLKNMNVMEPRGLMPGEVHYRIGRTYYRLREYSKAREAFETAIHSKVSEVETVPLSHYYMALINEEQGDKQQAVEHYRLVLKYSGPEEVLKDELEVARKKTRGS